MNKKCIIEGALIAYGEPLSIDKIKKMFREDSIKEDDETLSVKQIKDILNEISAECSEKGYELKEIASGYRLQVKSEYSKWISKLWEEKPPRYSKTILETLAIVAYKQPVTRAEIEEIRGVAVSTNVIRMLMDRQWIKIIAHKDVPGRPAVYGTTNIFLDYFNLSNLNELPDIDFSKLEFSMEVDDDTSIGFQLDQIQEDSNEMSEEQSQISEQQVDTDDCENENNIIDASSQFLEKQQNNLHEVEHQTDDEIEVNN